MLEVIDHFREMDRDRSGEISLKEFRQAIQALGFVHASKESVDATFAVLDDDRSGRITYSERAYRRRLEPIMDLYRIASSRGSTMLMVGGGWRLAACCPSHLDSLPLHPLTPERVSYTLVVTCAACGGS